MTAKARAAWALSSLSLACVTHAPHAAPRLPLAELDHCGVLASPPPPSYARPQIAGISVGEPQVCRGGSFIRVAGSGTKRRIGTERDPHGGFNQGCRELPSASGASECPIIAPGAVLHELADELRARGIEVNGIGGGPCCGHRGGYDDWNLSVGVLSWAAADTAIRLLGELLIHYDLSGYVGVAVVGIECAHDL